jgi:phospholipase/carboxylesterase
MHARFDDLSLRYLVTVPGGADDATLPLVVLIHGRGADMHDLADLAPLLDPPRGARFVFPNAPRPFEAYDGMTFGWTWFDGWPPEQPSVEASRALLLEFVNQLTDRYPARALVIGGFSQGAMMALDVGLRLETPPAGIVAMSGGLYEPDLPDLKARAGLPVLLAHGTVDDVVPVNYAYRARAVLENAGLDVTYHEYAMGHQVVAEEAEVVRDFLERVLA